MRDMMQGALEKQCMTREMIAILFIFLLAGTHHANTAADEDICTYICIHVHLYT